ncbi:acetylglutamate kinase [Metabacillus mangrovi]|uniref:acetylglutamate kinase n=1 Tax=Metabacillus mangrovi TaxID=1491830 RepID=UPI001F502655|nr:acetylglutamate kinase [Metabacillus mangrovi]
MKTVVIKCGGSILSELSDSFFTSIKHLKDSGCGVVLVHGGGPEITDCLEKMKIQTAFINGQRQTTKEVLEVVQMTLAGKLNKKLSGMCQKHGLAAVGLSGEDGGLLQAECIDEERLGLVGKVSFVDIRLLELLLEKGYLPVLAPLGRTENGEVLNINADTAAAAVAQALQAERLVFVTDVDGIMEDGQLVSETDPEQIRSCIGQGIISGGMIPKTESAIQSLSDTLKEVMIVNGTKPFISGREFVGTKIMNSRKEAAG